MTEARRTRHPAAASRLATAGLATALSFGLVTAMSWPSLAAPDPVDDLTWSLTPTTDPEAAPAPARVVRVIVRRHHAAPTEPTIRYVQAPPTSTPSRSTTSTTSAAPAPRPAPRPRTRSGGS